MSRYFSWLVVFLLSPSLFAQQADQLSLGRKGILSHVGCYLVDYSFVETESLRTGYVVKSDVYDVNKDKSIKEWIYADEISPSRIWLQHILFAVGLDGQINPQAMLKHTSEDWIYGAASLYDFVSPLHWVSKAISADQWTRKITNLDDGLRYQCAAQWNTTNANPEWSCGDNYAPIPGRETRDMHRKDYQTLMRSSRLITYGQNWLEREHNIKTMDDGHVRTPLARELGKTWYVRLADGECSQAQSFAKSHRLYWNILRSAWDEVFAGNAPFAEKATMGLSRYSDIMELEEQAAGEDLAQPAVQTSVRAKVIQIINQYRDYFL